jgi:hypothetical protein
MASVLHVLYASAFPTAPLLSPYALRYFAMNSV